MQHAMIEKRLSRIRMALAALGCLFIFAAFFGSMSRLDDINLSAEERIAIFSWTDLRQRLYLGGALFAEHRSRFTTSASSASHPARPASV
jgi:hypothetical protein